MKNEKNMLDLTQGNVGSQFVRFFLPVALGTVIQQLYNTADAFIVGHYEGTNALAACGGSSAMIIALIVGIMVSLTGGASVIVAHYFGEKDYDRIKKASGTAIVGCLAIGLIITALGIWLTPSILRFMQTPEDTMADAVLYLRIIFGASVFVIIYNMGAGILRAGGDSKRPFWYLLACCITNVILDWLFVAVFHWGVMGAAVATAGSQIISCVLVLVRLATADEAYKISLTHIRWDGFSLKRMLYLGIPAALQTSMYSVSNAMIQIGVNSLGTATVAGWCLCGKIDGIYWALMTAVGTSIMTFAGQNYGAGKLDRIKECTKKGLIMTWIGTVCMSTLIMLIAPKLIPFFDDNPEVIELTVYMLWHFVPFYFLWPAIEIFSGVLRGVGDAVVPVIILGITICLYRVVWLYTAFEWIHTLRMLCICYPISWLIASIPLFIRYKRGKWLNHNK